MVYPVTNKTLFALCRFFIKKTIGLDYIPMKGPYIIACKHIGPLDGLLIASKVIPKIKQKIFFITSIAQWGWFWEKIVSERWAGSIPFDRDNPKKCLDIAQKYLNKGCVVGIFPEGILQDYDPKKHHAKTGVARLALWSRVPIVPIGLVHDVTVRPDLPKYVRRRQAMKNLLLNPHSLEIHIGEPFQLTDFYNKKVDKELLYNATQFVMQRINMLTNIQRHNN